MSKRPDGYSLSNKMRKLRRQFKISAVAQALHGELIAICNESNWSTEFTCSNAELCAALSISENYLDKCRQELIDAGLIFYTSGKSKRQFGAYSFDNCQVQTTSQSEVNSKSTTASLEVNSKSTTASHEVNTKTTASLDEVKKAGLVQLITSPHEDYNKTKKKLNILNINIRKEIFLKQVMQFEKKYDKETLENFFKWFSQENHEHTKMGFELEDFWNIETRLKIWNDNAIRFKANKSNHKNQYNGNKKSEPAEAGSYGNL